MHTYPFSEAFVVVAGPCLPMVASSLSLPYAVDMERRHALKIAVFKIRIVPHLTLSPSHLCTAPPVPLFLSFLPYHPSPSRWHQANKVVGCWP